MDKMQKDALQAAKEIVVKFIESGRVSPASFSEVFPNIYAVVLDTLLESRERLEQDDEYEA